MSEFDMQGPGADPKGIDFRCDCRWSSETHGDICPEHGRRGKKLAWLSWPQHSFNPWLECNGVPAIDLDALEAAPGSGRTFQALPDGVHLASAEEAAMQAQAAMEKAAALGEKLAEALRGGEGAPPEGVMHKNLEYFAELIEDRYPMPDVSLTGVIVHTLRAYAVNIKAALEEANNG